MNGHVLPGVLNQLSVTWQRDGKTQTRVFGQREQVRL